MPAKPKFLLAQINTCVGDFPGNLRKIREALDRARKLHADVVVFPEMTVTGYPPEDLLFKEDFLAESAKAVRSLARHTRGLLVFVGGAEQAAGKLYNTAFVFRNGRLEARYRKMCLPNYGVFDEARYFTPGTTPLVVEHRGVRIAVSICEDLWVAGGAYARALKPGMADVLVNLSASPYERNKHGLRRVALAPAPKRLKIPLLYANLVGGQDELVFDGQSFAMDAKGRVAVRARAFEEDFPVVSWPVKAGKPTPELDPVEEVYRALVCGARDYVDKNRFPKALIGLSGGIDSALVAAIAVDALGASRVTGVTMPSDVTSSETLGDAHRLAEALGIEILELPIRSIFRAYESALDKPFRGTASGTAEENIQARIRGTLLMALSNKFGYLVLTTGNKSETATGYCTLYGDMAGGFAVIKDVPKTLVYKLSRYRNRAARFEIIPASIIRRAPTAELRPNQKDQDTLPPYAHLDRFIEHYVDRDVPARRAQALSGVSPKTAKETARLIDRNEYKRRQAPPGVKITSKAFGRDRRMPITNCYEG